ncbi:MAG: alpha-mannosidase [Bacteroidales bacterium]|nr:alpha-mannosidase [Bacteroidales bacterium]
MRLTLLTKVAAGMLAALLLAVSASASPAVRKQKKDPAKQDTIHVIGHAHMDMNWLWPLAETRKMSVDNLRQAVAFMKEFPDYTMLMSQAANVRFTEEQDPALFEEVKKFVDEGRLELVGGMWVESDQNMPSGEALARSFLLGQRYFLSRFGRMSKVGWLPDDFGHHSQLPQMLNLSGMDYYFFMRTSPNPGSQWWIGADGSRVLCYNNNNYNGAVNEQMREKLVNFPGGKGRILSPTGVGDHGGGPSRQNILDIHALDAKPGYPAVKFTTAEEFYRAMEKEMDIAGRPTHEGEMGFIFEGCYTNVAEVKQYNRWCENSLYENEWFNSLDWMRGWRYPSRAIADIWESVVFNQFHDIIPGSAIFESNRESVGRYIEAYRKSNELRDNALLDYAGDIPFEKGIGQPIVAFNVQPFGGKAIVEAEIFSYDQPWNSKLSRWGNYYAYNNVGRVDESKPTTVYVRDASGREYPAQVIGGKSFPPGWRSTVQFVVDDMPAGGYRTFYVDVEKTGVDNSEIPYSGNTFETDFYRIRINPSTGNIVSLIDKKDGREYVKAGEELNTYRMYLERKDGSMKSWLINTADKVEDVTDMSGKVEVTNGPVRACVKSERTWGRSRIVTRTYIYRSYPRIDYDVDVHWLETASDTTLSPLLRAVFPITMGTGADTKFMNGVPFNVVERPHDGYWKGSTYTPEQLNPEDPDKVERRFGQEVPVHRFGDVNDARGGFALMARTKYGYTYDKGELRLTLLRAGGNPDLYPNLGLFNIQYAICPHTGDWTGGLMQEAERYTLPVRASEPRSTSLENPDADLPTEASLVSLDKSNVLLTSMKKGEDGEFLVVRLCEMEGKDTEVTLNLPVQVLSVDRLDLLEFLLEDAEPAEVVSKGVKVKMKPHEIVTLAIDVE